jgi:hypothetical protein
MNSVAASVIGSLNQRTKDPVQEFLLEQAKNGPKKYIFNVFNLSHTRRLGSLGSFHIPAVETNGSDHPQDWEPYSKPLVIPHLILESWDRGEGQVSTTPWPADLIVADILGINEGQPANDLRNYGVFCAAGATPTKVEIEAAKKLLVKRLTEDLREGDRLWSGDSRQRNQVNHIHRRAARYLGIKREWSADLVAQANCPFCDNAINPGALKCTNCGEILDEVRYAAAKQRAAGHTAPKIPVPGKKAE